MLPRLRGSRRPIDRFVAPFVLISLLFTVTSSAAAPTREPAPISPWEQLESVKIAMLRELQDPEVRADAARLNAAVERILLPHIDMRTASQLVLGKYWKPLDREQRDAFVNEFERYLLRFYTEALSGYVRTREIPNDFMILESARAMENETQVVIESKIFQPRGEPVAVAYRLRRTDDWRVIDMSLRGISMVRLYRGQFSPVVEREGIDALTAQLRARNAELASP